MSNELSEYMDVLYSSDGFEELLYKLESELEIMNKETEIAKFRSQTEQREIQSAVGLLESTINGLASAERRDILARYKGFVFTYPCYDENFKFKHIIFKYDRLNDRCEQLSTQQLDFNDFKTIPVHNKLFGFSITERQRKIRVLRLSKLHSGKKIVQTPSKDISKARTSFGLATHGRKIFLVGGFESGLFSDSAVAGVVAYDTETDDSTDAPQLN